MAVWRALLAVAAAAAAAAAAEAHAHAHVHRQLLDDTNANLPYGAVHTHTCGSGHPALAEVRAARCSASFAARAIDFFLCFFWVPRRAARASAPRLALAASRVMNVYCLRVGAPAYRWSRSAGGLRAAAVAPELISTAAAMPAP